LTKNDTYDILYDITIKALKGRVEGKKMKGWHCVGGVFIEGSANKMENEKIYYQTVEKNYGGNRKNEN